MIKPDPIRIVQDSYARQCLDQLFRVVEVEGVSLDFIAKWILALQRVGQRPDPVAFVQQTPGNIFSGIAKGSGDGMDLLL